MNSVKCPAPQWIERPLGVREVILSEPQIIFLLSHTRVMLDNSPFTIV